MAWRKGLTLRTAPPAVQMQIYHAAALRLQLQDAQKKKLEQYHYNFAKWLHDCVEWPKGRKPTEYQDRIAQAIYGDGDTILTDSRTLEYGPHGIGKTALMSLILHHFSLSSEAMEMDWKAITTAGSNVQLKQYLWPEIRKWATLLKWDVMGLPPYTNDQLQEMSIKMRYGRAFAVNSANYAFIEGAHAKRLLYVFDEAKSIPDETFNATEGAFANVGTHGYEAYAVAMSTPGEEAGHFFKIAKREKGFEDWNVIHVTSQDAQKAGMHGKKWIDQRRRQWGEDSQLFINRVLGNFASKSTQGVIPLAWVEAAVDRWREWTDNGKKKPEQLDGILERIGVDAAWEGDDKSAIALAYTKKRIYKCMSFAKQDPLQLAGRVKGICDRWGGIPVVDVIGIGAGTWASLSEQGCRPEKFNAAEHSEMRDALDEFSMRNKRAAAWWQLRERLDPENREGWQICLPDDPILLGDLTAPRYSVLSNGVIQIESKVDIKRRGKRRSKGGSDDGGSVGIGRSTDKGDAVVMALFDDVELVKYMVAV